MIYYLFSFHRILVHAMCGVRVYVRVWRACVRARVYICARAVRVCVHHTTGMYLYRYRRKQHMRTMRTQCVVRVCPSLRRYMQVLCTRYDVQPSGTAPVV